RNRSEVTEVGGRHVIADLYNANPTSTQAAIDALVELAASDGEACFAILGDMLELGPEGPKLHRELGVYAAKRGVTGLIGIGKLGREIVRGALEAGMNHERVFM